jgi:hypothetical protein
MEKTLKKMQIRTFRLTLLGRLSKRGWYGMASNMRGINEKYSYNLYLKTLPR